MRVDISRSNNSRRYIHDGFEFSQDDLLSVSPGSFGSESCLGYLPMFPEYVGTAVVDSAQAEIDNLSKQIAHYEADAQEYENKKGWGFLLPGLWKRYDDLRKQSQAQADLRRAAINQLFAALNNPRSVLALNIASDLMQSLLLKKLLTNPGEETVLTAQDLLRQEKARQIVKDEATKSNNVAAFLIPAAIGAAAGFFL